MNVIHIEKCDKGVTGCSIAANSPACSIYDVMYRSD